MAGDRAQEKGTGGKQMPEAKPEHLKDIAARDAAEGENVKGGSNAYLGKPLPKL